MTERHSNSQHGAASVRDIVIVAAPRSGTNFFCECVSALRGISTYFEIFNPRGVMGVGEPQTLNHLSQALGVSVSSARDKELVRHFRSNPLAAVDILRDCAQARGDRALCYKVFPKQITWDVLGELLNRQGTITIFVVRRRLDVYVSYKKAQQQDVWKNRDTSDLQIEVDVDDFLNWAAEIDGWYEAVAEVARRDKLTHLVYDYDSDIDIPKPKLVDHLSTELSGVGFVTEPGLGVQRSAFKKQDRKKRPFKKISNAAALRDELRSRRAYRYALAPPLAEVPKPRARKNHS